MWKLYKYQTEEHITQASHVSKQDYSSHCAYEGLKERK